MSRAVLVGCLVLAGAATAGCQSTRDRAERLAATGSRAFEQEGLSVQRVDKSIVLLDRTVLSDANGSAVVIELRNEGDEPVARAPIALDVRDARGETVFRNDTPGLERALGHVPLLLPGHKVTWVNDQVLATGRPTEVRARVGRGRPAPADVPRIEIAGMRLRGDAVSGIEAVGKVTNASDVDQLELAVFVIARRGGEIVAAGRSIVPKLRAGRTQTFHAFFIGDPRGAQLSATAPPSVLA